MLKRVIICVLLLSTLLSCFVGCKKNDEGAEATTTATTAEGTKSILDTLPEKDFEGRAYNILVCEEGYNDTHYYAHDEDDGEPITTVSYERTKWIEDKYKIDMNVIENKDFTTLVRSNHQAGATEYDLIFPHPTNGIMSLMTEGYLANFCDLENCHMDEEWYNQSQVNGYKVNDKLYFIVSDYSMVAMGISALVYNKDMWDQQGFDMNPYEEVNNGTWTYEKFLKLIENFSVADDGTGTYGLQLREHNVDGFLRGFGEKITSRNEAGEFSLAFDRTRLSDIADKLYSLTWEHPGVYHATANNAQYPSSDLYLNFKDGKSLFATYDIGGSHQYLRTLQFRIGILPYPKLDTNQADYYPTCASEFFAIPSILSEDRQEESALILDALSRYSHIYMRPKFFETVLLGRMSESADDYKMLEMIYSKVSYDFGYTADVDGNLRSIMYEVIIQSKSKNTEAFLRKKSGYIEDLMASMNAIE
ncbi:MAG: hypothetical protein IJ038_06375 [Clostridia bacterium]|nr:hypothetical protein [Clostridia bacterium]